MFLKTICAIGALILAVSPSWAGTAAPLTYEQFEAAVPHLDLDSCPDALAQKNVFCRATLRHDDIHVFAFSNDGENLFVGFKSYTADGLAALLQ
ncbi:hypothetical protein [Roseovarius sp. M141]|uniref:hypothetical protein n=1 Tax=Roseovarius sp. M141 TaxID=2583806 RepID=UPI0020CEF42C|nr:hypothetical protein [Roseovarius sp. M141]MCQ0092778.1 hypothetical protein [Roseovarius sp. M141]